MLTSRGSLIALLYASAALATSEVLAEPIFGRDLEVRQAVTCPSSYTSDNGLNFTTYCNQNNPFNDAQQPFTSPSMQDCMEHCSRYWGNGEGCFGVVWIESDGECWIRNSTTSTANLGPDPGYYSALTVKGDMAGYNRSCPNTDLSINTLPGVDGLQYTTNCGKVISGYDDCFSGYASCWNSPYTGFYHTDTLEECLQICVDQHPLCRAVSWNPGLQIGFANCWPKTGFPQTLDDPSTSEGVIHSATITQIDTIDSTCLNKAYKAQDNKVFDVYCGELNAGTNITSLHTQNITACMEACSTSNEKCTGVLFDSSLQGGYKNCYLQNTTSVITQQSSATYAVITGTSAPSTGKSSSGGGSKAWIAGAVIGALAGLAIIGAAIFWWRRRKAASAAGGQTGQPGGYGPAPAYSPNATHPQPYYDGPMNEMDARGTSELPASTKYAHTGPAAQHAPQELPS